MIESIEFRNFRVLRDATLPLGGCTVLVGPNGSGKSTVLQALEAFREPSRFPFERIVTMGLAPAKDLCVEIRVNWGEPQRGVYSLVRWRARNLVERRDEPSGEGQKRDTAWTECRIERFRVFALEAQAIAEPAPLADKPELGRNGSDLAAVLDRLRDTEPERFEALNDEFARWLPEFDRITLDVKGGRKWVVLRTRLGQHKIPACDLSQGTLIALALLTLAYLPEPPSLIGLEEPDRGIHPRLLRHVQDAIYRLCYPADFQENREPVQVIATTHSPYFLDLFKDHPEEIVVANRVGNEVKFEPLSQRADIQEILGGAALGEAWYTGVLGGVPSQ